MAYMCCLLLFLLLHFSLMCHTEIQHDDTSLIPALSQSDQQGVCLVFSRDDGPSPNSSILVSWDHSHLFLTVWESFRCKSSRRRVVCLAAIKARWMDCSSDGCPWGISHFHTGKYKKTNKDMQLPLEVPRWYYKINSTQVMKEGVISYMITSMYVLTSTKCSVVNQYWWKFDWLFILCLPNVFI